ncbi:MAG: right-handed parallel beta-helix repeat-containing protein [Fibrobacteres bacterium]|jgi:hypothetical protein|nr:right-handed parallel beta-helix repeat-containing protein [Fibrobacterota bacterium]
MRLSMILLLALSCASFPKSYFFASDGADAGAGSQASPWKSSAKYKSLSLVAGDSVLFKRGSVWAAESLFISAQGSPTHPIVFSSWGDTRDSAPHLHSPGRLVVLTRSSDLILENLRLSGARGGCVELWDSTNTRIVIQDIEASQCGGGVYATGTDLVIRRNFIHDGKMVVNTPGAKGTVAGDDDYGASGIGLGQVNGCKVYSNRLENLKATSYDYGTDGGAFEFWRTVRNCDIHSNFSRNTDGFMEFGGLKGDSVVDVSIHHNLILDAGTAGCFHMGGAGSEMGVLFDKIRFDHNLSVDRYQMPWGYHLYSDGPRLDRPERIQVRNNIFVSDSAKFWTLDWTAPNKEPAFLHRDNLLWSPKLNPFKDGWVAGPGETFADPLFANPAWNSRPLWDTVAADYAPSGSSPAVKAGQNLGYAVDYFGKSYAQGEAVDLGPFSREGLSGFLAGRTGNSREAAVRVHGSGKGLVVESNLEVSQPCRLRLLGLGGEVLQESESWQAPLGPSSHQVSFTANLSTLALVEVRVGPSRVVRLVALR